MMTLYKTSPHSHYWLAFALLFFLIAIPYSNTFNASWHLDDYPIVIYNPYLKITNLQPQTLFQTFYADPDDGKYLKKKIYRPISCLTLALNWYVGQHNVFGYHLVNITIHFLTACMLFVALNNFLKTPNLKAKYRGNDYFIALLATSLWAINPIQTQAVTYIVQRMAALSAMFYILGLYFYIKARMAESRKNQIFLYLGCFMSYLFALASKENAATLPLAVVLLEALFFQDFSQSRVRKWFLTMTFGVGFCIVVFGVWFYLQGDLSSILKGYERRSFSPMQRLMTEPSILVYYLTQIFYPTPARLSIGHDFAVSTSLFQPWTTLPAMLIIFLLIALGVIQIRKRPLLSLSILFFFLNHLIESTIVGLELSFEHRNYLPTLFIFLPVAAAFKTLLDHYRKQKPSMHGILIAFMILLLIGMGTGTYIRNMAWATEKSLWEDAMQKAPGMARPYHNLGWAYYQRNGQYDKALYLYEKAFNLKKHNKFGKSLALNNMASVYYLKGDLNKAAALWTEVVRLSPQHGLFQYRLARILADLGKLEQALEPLDKVISRRPHHIKSLNLKGIIFLKQRRFQEALSYFQRSVKLKSNDKAALFNLGRNFRLLGYFDRAGWYFKTFHANYPKDIPNLLWLIENHLAANNKRDADLGIEQLFAVCDVKTLLAAFELLRDENIMPEASQVMLIHGVASKLKENSETISQLGAHSKQPPHSLKAYGDERYSRKN
jgi:Flp pilus assembly protein TadD